MSDCEGEKLRAPADFDGPTSDRRCTDVFCSLLLLMTWVAMTALGIYAVQTGDYRIVLYPLDYDGNICGTDYGQVDMTEYPYLFTLNYYTGGVCVKECPSLSVNDTVDGVTDVRTLITYGGVWQSQGAELASDFVEVGNYSSDDALYCDEETCFPGSLSASWTSTGINRGYGFAYYVADSYEWLGYCYLTDEAEQRIEELVLSNSTLTTSASSGATEWVANLYADLWTARYYVLGFGFGIAVAISFVYTFLLRFPCLLNIVIWGSIFLSLAMFGLAGYYAVDTARRWEEEEPRVQSDANIRASRIFGIVLWAVSALLVLFIICLRKQIQLSIGCVKEASRAITRMPAIMLLPLLQCAGLVLFMIALFTYGVHLASLGEVSRKEITLDPLSGTTISYRTYDFDAFVTNSGWFLLFCFFWTSNFIVAVGDMTVAMSVAKWYFTRDKRVIGSCTVVGSLCDVQRFHLGTCAYGSLLIALVQIIRAILTRIQKKIKEMDNGVANCLLCCCQCCLFCLEKCLKYLSKNAYIQTAIFGTSFCKSCRAAFSLIFRNAARVGALTYVAAAILVIGKLFISTITTGLGYFFINEQIHDELHSIVGPVVFIFLVAYFVSDMFMDIFDLAIDTILHCFVADEEMFDQSECYAQRSLRRWIDKHRE